MVERLVDWSRSRRGMWWMALAAVLMWAPLVIMLVERQSAWRADRETSAAEQFMVAAWLSEPIFAEDNHIEIKLGDNPQTTRIYEGPESDGPRVLLTKPTPGVWYTQLWHEGRMICRSPLASVNAATYGPDSPRELDMTWAQYADDEEGDCFDALKACETFELRALRELRRTIGGEVISRYVPPLKRAFAVPCDWRRG